MPDDLYEWSAERLESEEENVAFYRAIVEAQCHAREDRARRFQALASDTLLSEDVPL